MSKINWTRYIKDDESTHPEPAQELMVIGLQNCKVKFFPHAYFGVFGRDFFYEVISTRGSVVNKRKEHKVDSFEDLAWVYLDTPSWWIDKKDQQ